MNDEKLKECPFCGGQAVFEPEASRSLVAYTCNGDDCNNYQYGVTQAEAFRRWQRRAPSPVEPQQRDVERAKDIAWECAEHKTFGPSYLNCAYCITSPDGCAGKEKE